MSMEQKWKTLAAARYGNESAVGVVAVAGLHAFVETEQQSCLRILALVVLVLVEKIASSPTDRPQC